MKEFDGENDRFTLEQFLVHVDALKRYNEWSDTETGEIVGFHLMGEALESMEPSRLGVMGWTEVKAALHKHFRPSGREPLLRAQLQQCKRREGDTLAQYAAKLRRLGRMAYPGGLENPQAQFALVDVFVRGQGDKIFQREAYTHNVFTLSEALALAERSEAGQRSIEYTWPSKPKRSSDVHAFNEQRSSDSKDEGLIARVAAAVTSTMGASKPEYNGGDKNVRRDRDSRDDSRGRDKNVRWRQSSRENSGNRNRTRSQSRDRGPVRCYRCQGYGHFADECPSQVSYEIGKDGKPTPSKRNGSRSSSSNKDDPKAQGGPVRSPDTSPN